MAFTASTLNTVLEKADKIWADRIQKADYEANADVIKSVTENQTASFEALKDPEKDNKVKIVWINACGTPATDYVADCTVDGEELTTDSKEYEIDTPYEKTYKIKESVLRTNLFGYEEMYAKAFMKADKFLTEKLAGAIVSKMESWVATSSNPYNVGSTWTVPALGVTNIPANQWTPDILGHLILAGKLSKFSNPYLVTGLNLAHSSWKAQKESGQSGNEGNVEMFKSMKQYYDLFNIDSTAAANRTYMIDRNAICLATKTHWGNVPTEYGNGANMTRYSIASMNMPGVRYDVIYKTTCENDEIIHHFKFILRTGVFLNPTGCDNTGRTGLLGFHKS